MTVVCPTGTLNPVFKETFELPLPPGPAPSLAVEVWDQDRGSSDEFLGEAELDLADILGASTQVRLPEPTPF